MKEIKWYFPKSLEEVPELLKKDGTIPHGGGTSILRGRLNKIKGLIDLTNLPLHFFRDNNGNIEIGAAQTFAEVSEAISSIDPGNILARALKLAAATPLRNRITLGGSIASFPAWSDLMGPLIALDAEVSLIGAKEGIFNIARYLANRELRNHTLITGVIFKIDRWASSYYRETRTHFDYPAFTITILLKKDKNIIKDIRIVIVGCIGKFKRLTGLEESLKGKAIGRLEIEGIGSNLEVEFTGKKGLSPGYIKYLAGVQIERGLVSVLRR